MTACSRGLDIANMCTPTAFSNINNFLWDMHAIYSGLWVLLTGTLSGCKFLLLLYDSLPGIMMQTR